jgi:hypothetical protein
MELYGYSLDELLVQRDIHLGASYKTQVRKMIAEQKSKEFLDSLEYTPDGFPIIPCVQEGSQFVFWCPFCKRKHYHSPSEGHRVPHCHSDKSPFPHGYVLRLKK